MMHNFTARRGRNSRTPEPLRGRLSWLFSERTSFFVSLFFAALAWTLIRTVDRLAATPIVEYRLTTSEQAGAAPTDTLLRLRNLTRAQPVNCIIVIVRALQGNLTLTQARTPFRLYGPIMANATVKAEEAQASAELELTDFPPGADIGIGFSGQRADGLKLQAKSCSPGMLENKVRDERAQLPVFMERSLQTGLIDQELTVLWSGLGLWAVLLLTLAQLRTMEQRKE